MSKLQAYILTRKTLGEDDSKMIGVYESELHAVRYVAKAYPKRLDEATVEEALIDHGEFIHGGILWSLEEVPLFLCQKSKGK